MLVKINDKMFEEEERAPLPLAKCYRDTGGRPSIGGLTEPFRETPSLEGVVISTRLSVDASWCRW